MPSITLLTFSNILFGLAADNLDEQRYQIKNNNLKSLMGTRYGDDSMTAI